MTHSQVKGVVGGGKKQAARHTNSLTGKEMRKIREGERAEK